MTKSVPTYQLRTKDNTDNINDQQCNEDNNNKNDNNSSKISITYNQSEVNKDINIIQGNRKCFLQKGYQHIIRRIK